MSDEMDDAPGAANQWREHLNSSERDELEAIECAVEKIKAVRARFSDRRRRIYQRARDRWCKAEVRKARAAGAGEVRA